MTTETAHTPEWSVSYETMEYGFSYVITEAGTGPVAYIPSGGELTTAHLLAAAPDMLAALEAMVTSYRGPRENLDAARAVIAKAKGGAS